jgi:hypothetical protein
MSKKNDPDNKEKQPRVEEMQGILSEQIEELSESVLDDVAGGAVTGPIRTIGCSTGD